MSTSALRGRARSGSRSTAPSSRGTTPSSSCPPPASSSGQSSISPLVLDIDLVPGTNIELNTLPREFLQAYPYPAFVLATAIPPTKNEHSGPWTPMTIENIHPLTPVWCNRKWSKLASGKRNNNRSRSNSNRNGSTDNVKTNRKRNGTTSLLDCLSLEGMRKFGAWVMESQFTTKSGDNPEMSSNGTLGITLNPPSASSSGSLTPRRGVTPNEKDHAKVDEQDDEGGFDDEALPEPPISLNFSFAPFDSPVTFELTKTTQPIYIWHKGERSVAGTHVFTVITAIPRPGPPTDTRLVSGVGLIASTPSVSPSTSAQQQAPASADATRTPRRSEESPGAGLGPPPLVDPSPPSDVSPTGSTITVPGLGSKNTNVDKPPRRVVPTTTPLVQHPDAVRLLEEMQASGETLFFLRHGGLRHLSTNTDMGESEDGLPLSVAQLSRSIDWSKSPMGPESEWSESLKCMIGFLNVLPLSAAMWWGKDLTLFYNQAYAEHLQHHPSIYGQSGTASWAELWTTLGPLTEVVLKGTSIFKEDGKSTFPTRLLTRDADFVLRKQIDEDTYIECYNSQLWAPFRLPDGSFGGVMHSVLETSGRVLSERRSLLLRQLEERTANARSVEDFYSSTLEVLEDNARDAPFALLFTVDPQSEPRTVTRHTVAGELAERTGIRAKVRYVGGVGVPEGHPSAPTVTDVVIPPRGDPSDVVLAVAFSNPELRSSACGVTSPPPMKRSPSSQLATATCSHSSSKRDRESSAGSAASLAAAQAATRARPITPDVSQWPFVFDLHSGRPVLVKDCSLLIKGYPIRVWDEAPTSAIVIPILRNTHKDVPVAVLVLGLSCRLPFDDSYEEFIHLLQSQMSTQLAAIRGYHADQLRIEELGTLDRTKSALFSNVARQLFTPLALVAGPLDDAIVDMEPGPSRDMLKLARRNVRRLTRLASILRDVSNLEAGRFTRSFEHVNLGEVTRDGAALFRRAASRAHLEYIVDCDVTPQEVYLDREKWDKIMFTLIGNAIHFTPTGSVRVSLAYEDNEAVLTVQDTGIGIPAADLKYIGEEFYRSEYPGKQDGSGVTLPFAKKLIEMHAGVLEVESKCAREREDGAHGSTFRVRIPIGSSHLPPDSIAAEGESAHADGWERAADVVDDELFEQESRGGSTAGSGIGSRRGSNLAHPTPIALAASSPNLSVPGISPSETPLLHTAPLSPAISRDMPDRRKGYRRGRGIDPSTLWFDPSDVVMIVDDTRRYLHSILSPFCRVVEARDGGEALEKFDSAKPDLIIAEFMLPRSNGVELLRTLREGTKKQRVVPFLLLTSAENERPEDALDADDLLSKPFNARELVARAHLQLQLGKKRRSLERMFEERTRELRVITDKMPIGIFQCTPDGYVSYANEAWYELAGYPRGKGVTNWGDYIAQQDQARIRGVWEAYLSLGQMQASAEWQWTNRRYVSTKVISLQTPGDDKPMGSIGCCVDITDRILHENLQKQRVAEAEQRRAEAEEAKFQQELLIDITSHEIRNPISSLMQSNLLMLQEHMQYALDTKSVFTPTRQLLLTIGEDLEALDSIYECGLTQERISNDVLSLGKIQLDMMQMCDDDRPVRREAHKITSVFKNEARMKRIALSLDVSPAFDELGVNSIKTDHVRLGQVVTNLLTNAIRFTANSPVRKIELGLDIGLDPPETGCAKPKAKASKSASATQHPVPVPEDTPLYLFVSVSDTGPGLTPHELEMLFQRFSQASPKTHTVYGGSGLGLFVCRKLTELMGGRIDVSSQPGTGSKFSFFITARAGVNTDACAGTPVAPPMSPVAGAAALLRKANVHLSPAGVGRNGSTLPPDTDTAHKWRVLVVEDNLINRTVLIRQLKHVGLEVDDAEDGQEALVKIQRAMASASASASASAPDAMDPKGEATDAADAESESEKADMRPKPYDAVLMDLEMPVMDGYTAAQRVRAAEDAGELDTSLVIALTGNARQARIDEAMADFDDVVVKPYRLDDLLKKMETLILQRGEQVDTPAQRRRAKG